MLTKPQQTVVVCFCEQQRCTGRCGPPPSYQARAKVKPHQEVVVWGVYITVSTFLLPALGKKKENKDDKVKGALWKLCPELQSTQ